MKRFIVACVLIAFPVIASAQDAAISRRDAFMHMWSTIKRPAVEVREAPYSDVPAGSSGFLEITYAKARGLLPDDIGQFRPDDPVTLEDALLWMLRTRNVEPINLKTGEGLMDIVEPEQLAMVLERYPIISLGEPGRTLSREELVNLTAQLDAKLAAEVHEFSSYSEKFHGDGTAFGETFDMHALTAAHRTYPHNTLVKVTNSSNGKSVTVRINDRGPFVVGRDMDLSLAAFLTIEDRSKGIGYGTFERLGDASLVTVSCTDDRSARRITKDVILDSGVPRSMKVGSTLTLGANGFFAIETITHPDGSVDLLRRWVSPQSERTEKEAFTFTPTHAGTYTFLFRTKEGKKRTMSMEAVECAG